MKITRVLTYMSICILAGSIVASACGDPEDESSAAGDDTPTIESSAPEASPTPEPAAEGTIETNNGLTETGFTAPDGRPLYEECMQEGAPIPPVIPVPSGEQPAVPTVNPNPNEGRAAPSPDELPSFDPFTIPAADSSAWPIHDSACYGYSVALPPGWEATTPFTQVGYQQGETATYVSPNETARVTISVSYTPAESSEIANSRVSLSRSEYLISGPTPIELDGAAGVRSYVYVGEPSDRVYTTHRYSPREDWYVSIGVYLIAPYDEVAAQQARAIVESLSFR